MPTDVDCEAVSAWLADRVENVELPLTLTLIPGGMSNLTYRITDRSGRQWVLRRPPLHGVITSAHDMGREHRIISHLAGTEVPVPGAIGYEPDPRYIGAPFYVMENVDGLVLRNPVDAIQSLDRPARSTVGDSMVETLLALHAVDPESVGLGDLGRREGYLIRQLEAWGRQLDADSESTDSPLPILREVRDQLGQSIPYQQQTSIVHGDYRLDNVVISPEGRVTAVLDWELCTLGDPAADIATLAVYWSDRDDTFFPLESATVASGFTQRRNVIAAYMKKSPLDFSRFPYYLAFASWRLGVVLHGVLKRYEIGAYGKAARGDWEKLRIAVPRLAEMSLNHLSIDSPRNGRRG